MFNTEGSKDVLRKQKYHSGLCGLCLGTVSSNHSQGDSDKQDLGVGSGGKKRRKLNKTCNAPQNDVKNRKMSVNCLMPLSP